MIFVRKIINDFKNYFNYSKVESPKKKSPKISPRTSPVKDDFILEENNKPPYKSNQKINNNNISFR